MVLMPSARKSFSAISQAFVRAYGDRIAADSEGRGWKLPFPLHCPYCGNFPSHYYCKNVSTSLAVIPSLRWGNDNQWIACYSRVGGNQHYLERWIPAFAGMTCKSLSCFVNNVVTNPGSLKRLKVESGFY